MIKLFIGYRKDTSTAANLLSTILESLGVKTWIFEETLQPGEEFVNEIHDIISKKANAAIFILNEEVLKSEFIMKFELPWASKKLRSDSNFIIFPVLYKESSKILERFGFPNLPALNAIKLENDDFDSVLQVSGTIFSKLLETNIIDENDHLNLSIFDRIVEKPLEVNLLNLNLVDLLGNTEKVLIRNWGRLQKVLEALTEKLRRATTKRKLKLQGRIRYTTSFLLGYALRDTTGFRFAIDYNTMVLETPPNHIITHNPLKTVETPGGPSENLIVDVSLARNNIDCIQKYIKESQNKTLKVTDPILSLTPIEGVGRNSIKDNGMAQQVSLQIFKEIENARDKYSSDHVHLFINGPWPIALFLGWLWNAGPSVYIYEFDKTNTTYFDNPYHVKL